MTLEFKGLELDVDYDHHPFEKGDLETPDVEAEIVINDVFCEINGDKISIYTIVDAFDELEPLIEQIQQLEDIIS